MDYIIKTAQGDYASLDLKKSGNKYVVYVYVYGYGITYKREFDRYEDAERHYFDKCRISGVTPVNIEIGPAELLVNAD